MAPPSKAPVSPPKKITKKHAPGTAKPAVVKKTPAGSTKKQSSTNLSKSSAVTTTTTTTSANAKNTAPSKASITKTKTATKQKESRDDDEHKRKRMLICLAIICCLLILGVVGVVLALTVFKNDDNGSSGSPSSSSSSSGGSSGPNSSGGGGVSYPTQAPVPLSPSVTFPVPTRMPTPTSAPVPTVPQPTEAPVVQPTSLVAPTSSRMVIVPYADNVIYRDGFYVYENYGTEDTILVQNGPQYLQEVPDTIGLIAFDLTNVPSSASKVILQLYHVAEERNRGACTITIRRMPSTNLAIETLHGGIYNPDDDEGTVGPSFSVDPSDGKIQVDITSLVLPIDYSDEDSMDLLLMLQNVGEEQGRGAEGDNFYTRETEDPPQLLITI